MKHTIKLQPEYYNYVLNGTKSFLKRLLHYSSFVDMFKDFDIFILVDKFMKKENLINELGKFYIKDQ